VRIFDTYGPRMHQKDGRVVPNFIVQALRGEDITIYGDGAQTRSFCYIDDLIEAIIRTMNTSDDFTGPVNIGNPREFTVLQLATLVLQMVGLKSKLVFKSLPSDDPRQCQPNISLAKKRCSIGFQRSTLSKASKRPSGISGITWRSPDAIRPHAADVAPMGCLCNRPDVFLEFRLSAGMTETRGLRP
jgi:nucleoside-diphosphate-sugar epimerase